jgi:lysine 2,3-aminomutase
MSLEDDRFAEKTTKFVRALARNSDAIKAIYFRDERHEVYPAGSDQDLYLEKQRTVVKGLICKYPTRALFLLSYTCAANCRYCERQDRVGVGLDKFGRLTKDEITAAVSYLSNRVDITEVIFSGGDPLTNMPGLKFASDELAKIPHVKTLRIHTRFPLQYPEAVKIDLLQSIVASKESYYLSLHIDHPDELTTETETVIRALRRAGFILTSQTVFLCGVNDNVDTLAKLFSRLMEIGVRPYYIYHCAPIPATQHFVVKLADEIRIMSQLRQEISGLAMPQHILEMQHTSGKVAVPSNHWSVDLQSVRDFYGVEVSLEHYAPQGIVDGQR